MESNPKIVSTETADIAKDIMPDISAAEKNGENLAGIFINNILAEFPLSRSPSSGINRVPLQLNDSTILTLNHTRDKQIIYLESCDA